MGLCRTGWTVPTVRFIPLAQFFCRLFSLVMQAAQSEHFLPVEQLERIFMIADHYLSAQVTKESNIGELRNFCR